MRDVLGADRAGWLTHIWADGAEPIHDVVTDRAPRAQLCLDPLHVVAWATQALDQVRRTMVAQLRAGGHDDEAAALKGSRWALLRNPPDLTGDQRTTLASIAKANGGLYRAYLLKEQLREIFACRDPGRAGRAGRAIPPTTASHRRAAATPRRRRGPAPPPVGGCR